MKWERQSCSPARTTLSDAEIFEGPPWSGACSSLSFSFCAPLTFSRRCYDSPLHVFNFSPFESSFLIPLVRILENPRCRTRIRSFLGQPLRPQDPSRTRKGSQAKETHQTAPSHVRKKDSGRHKDEGNAVRPVAVSFSRKVIVVPNVRTSIFE